MQNGSRNSHCLKVILHSNLVSNFLSHDVFLFFYSLSVSVYLSLSLNALLVLADILGVSPQPQPPPRIPNLRVKLYLFNCATTIFSCANPHP